MPKLKPISVKLKSASVRRSTTKPLSGGMMATPIPSEQRDRAHEEMARYIQRSKGQESKS